MKVITIALLILGMMGVVYVSAYYFAKPIIAVISITTRPGKGCAPTEPTCPGFFQVVILSTSSFDATRIIPSSLKFFEGFEPSGARIFPYRNSAITHIGGDRKSDMVSFFDETPPGIGAGATIYCLSGTTIGGINFKGCGTLGSLPLIMAPR